VRSKLLPWEYYDDGHRKVNRWSMVMPAPEEFLADTQRAALKVAKKAFEMAVEVRRNALVGAASYGRSGSRRDYRNGYYTRKKFATAIGTIENLRLARCRNCSLVQNLRRQLDRGRGKVEAKIVEAFLLGVSTRNVGELLEGLIGVAASPGQVSKLTRRLDVEVKRFHERPLADRYQYLFLDGIHLKSRGAPRLFKPMCQVRRRVVLTAYGVTFAGVKELIGFRVEKTESALGWRRFLLSLQRRGLTGMKLELVATDGSQGLIEAVAESFPEAKHQRCWFHKMSNVLAKVRVRHRRECLTGLRRVYTAKDRGAAEEAYWSWARRWKREEAEAVRCVERDLEALLVFFDFPAAHRKMIRTTNAIERCFREVRRRTRSIGCFINQASLERIIYALFSLLNQRRAGKICREFRSQQAAA
jgi:putative transposase